MTSFHEEKDEEVAFFDLANLGYEIWLNDDPQSVKERRMRFLNNMGFDRIITESSSGAVSSSSSSCSSIMDNNSFICDRQLSHTSIISSVDEDVHSEASSSSSSSSFEDYTVMPPASATGIHICDDDVTSKKKTTNWWKHLSNRVRKSKTSNQSKSDVLARVNVRQNKKQYMELSAVYNEQQFVGHKGMILTMKFSPDAQLLATGGEDGVVRIWSIVHPNKVLHIEESPLYEFHGHSSDVLDLAWSSSNLLLSSSKDNTVRLWKIGFQQSLHVFTHTNYVTCIQFNPVDESYFISGSIDGKVRIWGVQEKRVVNWADARDIITALCYQPDAKGFVVGLISGICRFYETSGTELLLHTELHISDKKKSSGNRITGIQFLKNTPQQVMITSEDSKIRILDGIEVVHKYKGLAKSRSQMSASFTSSGKHIISVGEDSRIYIWNHEEIQNTSSKRIKSVRSCEHFLCDAVSVAIPWPASETEEEKSLDKCKVYSSSCSLKNDDYPEASSSSSSSSCLTDSKRFSLANWFSMEISSRGSVTWPEEKLPFSEDCDNESGTCGLVIVAAGLDGKIRTFKNYGSRNL